MSGGVEAKEQEKPQSGSQPSARNDYETLPKINQRHNGQNKIYRAPPTPPLEKLYSKEKAFVLDSVAVSNISHDYSRANPKLGSVIPPYNSLEDKTISKYFENYGVKDMLKKSGQLENSESIAGRVHDRFFSDGTGFKYLASRNKFGNGRHPETFEGHSRYMGENSRVMIGYNNMYGYRRNVPKLRTEPPSTFQPDPRWFERLKRIYGEHFSEDELVEHFKHTYLIGYPFYDNNYNNFHPNVKYVITVKIGEQSPDAYEGNLGINIVARNFDTGFIKLDENIVKETYNQKRKEKENKDDNTKKRSLFRKGKTDVFEFEDQDIRMISAIILSKDVKGEEVLYVDYIDVDIYKPSEKQSYRFPYNGWVRGARQDPKSEELKERFGKKNSLILYPNENPKFDYTIVIAPKLFRDTEYTIEVNYDVRELQEQFKYEIEFGQELPQSGRLLVNLFGEGGENVAFAFDRNTKSVDEENPLVFSIDNKEMKKIRYATLMYDDKQSKTEYTLENFQVIDPDGEVFLFEIDEKLKPNKEMKVPSKYIKDDDQEETDEQDSPLKRGKLYIKMQGQSQSTGFFLLKDPLETKKKTFKFKISEILVDKIQSLKIKYEGSKKEFCKIKSITVKSNKGHDFIFDRKVVLRNKEEVAISNRSKSKKALTADSKSSGQLQVQVFGEKKTTDLFVLKDPTTNENDVDEFLKTENDIGKVKSVYIKYDDRPENKNSVNIKYIEIIDPRGNSYKFVMDASLKSGEDVMLPRKPGTKPREEDEKKPEPEKKNEAKPKQSTEKVEPKGPELVEYAVKVSKGIGASNVPISLTIYGDKGTTEKIRVEPKSESLIDINKDESVMIKGADVGKIQKVMLDYEAKGLKSAWFLNEIQITLNSQVVKFPVDRAFTNDETIELKPGEKPPGIDVKSLNPMKKL